MTGTEKITMEMGKEIKNMKLENIQKVRDVLDNYFLSGIDDDTEKPSFSDYKDATMIINEIIDIKLGITDNIWSIQHKNDEES